MNGYIISAEDCIGCTACKNVCPTDAIIGEIKESHTISEELCIACGACVTKCPADAIDQA
jgi:Na+-translocating ferredoxin:NAD+ oxidoreductase RNF subunit RnfB